MQTATAEKKARTVTVTVRVLSEDGPENPREAWDHFTVFAGWHSRYSIGDVQPKEDPEEWLKANAPPGSVVLPVYMMDHGAVSYSTGSFGDPWDSGQVGYIVATPDVIRKEYSVKRITPKIRKQVEALMKSEIETYNAWANGDVWGFDIEGEGYADSCWGFYGSDTTLEAMKEHVDEAVRPALETAWENRFDSHPGVEVELPAKADTVARLDSEDLQRERARSLLTAHGFTILHDAAVFEDAAVEEAPAGEVWVTCKIRLPEGH